MKIVFTGSNYHLTHVDLVLQYVTFELIELLLSHIGNRWHYALGQAGLSETLCTDRIKRQYKRFLIDVSNFWGVVLNSGKRISFVMKI